MNTNDRVEVHRIPGDNLWCVRYSANHFYFSLHPTIEEALSCAKRLAEMSATSMVIIEGSAGYVGA